MKSWILIAVAGGAAVFVYDSLTRSIFLSRQIRCRPQKQKPNQIKESKRALLERFSTYLAEEMELACGAGTNARLVICADSEMVQKMKRKLSMSFQSLPFQKVRDLELVNVNASFLDRLAPVLSDGH